MAKYKQRKNLYLVPAALLFIFSAAYALPSVESVNVDFLIQNDMAVAETINAIFSEAINSTISYKPESYVSGLSVASGASHLPFKYVKSGDTHVIEIQAHGKSEITISFVSRGLVFSSSGIYQFIADMNFDVPVKRMNAKLSLPGGYGIYDGSFTPMDGVPGTDGKNIIIEWNLAEKNSAVFSAKFYELNRQFSIEVFVMVVVAALAVTAVFYYRKKGKQEFLTGFREDEKKVIAYMSQHKTAYQNAVEKEFHFSRAKMTRIAKHLALEGVLEKKKYGRTNRLTWKRK